MPTKAPIVDWWSTRRNMTGPKGVVHASPRMAAISFSVSVDFAFFSASKIAVKVEYPTTEPRRGLSL